MITNVTKNTIIIEGSTREAREQSIMDLGERKLLEDKIKLE